MATEDDDASLDLCDESSVCAFFDSKIKESIERTQNQVSDVVNDSDTAIFLSDEENETEVKNCKTEEEDVKVLEICNSEEDKFDENTFILGDSVGKQNAKPLDVDEYLEDYDDIEHEFSLPVPSKKSLELSSEVSSVGGIISDDDSGTDSIIVISPVKKEELKDVICDEEDTSILRPGMSFLVKGPSTDVSPTPCSPRKRAYLSVSPEDEDQENILTIDSETPKPVKVEDTDHVPAIKKIRCSLSEDNILEVKETCSKNVGSDCVAEKLERSTFDQTVKTVKETLSDPAMQKIEKIHKQDELSQTDIRFIMEVFPSLKEEEVRKEFERQKNIHKENITERVIEYFISCKSTSSDGLQMKSTNLDVQEAIANPRPNLEKKASDDKNRKSEALGKGIKKGTGSKGKALVKKLNVQTEQMDCEMRENCSSDELEGPFITITVGAEETDSFKDVKHDKEKSFENVNYDTGQTNSTISELEVTSSMMTCDACNVSTDLEKVIQCCDCHLVCQTCLEKQVKQIMSSESQETQILCPMPACPTYIPKSQARKILPSLIMDLLDEKLNKKAMESIVKMEDFHCCPFCGFPVAVDHGLKEFVCPNDQCKKKSCRYCKKLWNAIDHVQCTTFVNLLSESAEELEPPKYWDPMPEQEKDFITVKLDKNGREFMHILELFRKTMHPVKLLSIRRIQNPRLWQKFSLTRKHMKEDIGSQELNEQQLFHGTAWKAIEAICRDGLDWRMCGENGTTFGQGTYFAKAAAYSDGYSAPVGSASNLTNPGFNFKNPGPKPVNAVYYTTSPSRPGFVQMWNTGFWVPAGLVVGLPGATDMSTQPNQINSNFGAAPNALSGIGHQPGFGTVTFAVPFGESSHGPCDSSNERVDIPNITSNINQLLQKKCKYMFVARVLVGRCTHGQHSIRKPPVDKNDPKGRPFNSCVNNIHSPSIFVIFDSAQCYPEYLIEYTNTTTGKFTTV